MIHNKRKSKRRQIRYTAWLVLEGDHLHGCMLSDASDTGARLEVENSKIVPDTFMLLLAGNGSAQRTCRVVWRKPHQVGVKFERRPAERKRGPVVPVIDGDDNVRLEPAETA
ncbi:MAG: PilZ domain-containing protein [Rhizobiales bacterium]|nr:PilZ domain-containing protein [Hyphomicrobiales bacterium]